MDTASDTSASQSPRTALESIRALVRDKTRFEPEDIHQVREDDGLQFFSIETTHKLEAKIEQMAIDGHFQPGEHDRNCGSAQGAAQSSIPERVKLAAQVLWQQLQKPGTRYNDIDNGILLPHETRHWYLHNCFNCQGAGRVTCQTCDGKKEETCWRCNGSKSLTCDVLGCLFGKVNCTACYGTGTVSQQVSYQITVQVPVTNWVDGVAHTTYHTEFRTEYRTEQHTCTAYGCSYGKVQCSRCVGTGNIGCSTCSSTGRVTCRTCSGMGTLACGPCRASGSLGTVAWVDVHVNPAYRLKLPQGSAADAQAICDKEGPHGLVAAARSLSLAQLQTDPSDVPKTLTAYYRGDFRIVHLDAACNQNDYHLVAYGQPLKWLTTDGIVEDLLRKDLEVLRSVLSEVADDGFFAIHIEHLLEPLRNVTASELNAELVEAALGDGLTATHAAVVSTEYVVSIQKSILGSLRQIYTRSAKRFWWVAFLSCLSMTGCVWSVSTADWGMLAGFVTLLGTSLLFTYRVRRVLTSGLGSPARAMRAMRIATKSKRYLVAQGLVLGPGVFGVLALGLALPYQGTWALQTQPTQQEQQVRQESAQQPVAPSLAISLESALAFHKQGDLQQARFLLKQLVEQRNTAAAGPYGWMLLTQEGLPPEGNADTASQHTLAQQWIDEGMAQSDIWAQAAKGLALARGWGEKRNTARGLEMLKQAANAGHAGAMHNLGLIYAQGLHVPINRVEARKWFTMAADLGSPGDIYQVGLMDWYGHGLKRLNRSQAMERWRKAAELGEPRAIEALANGRPPKKLPSKSTNRSKSRQ